MADDAAFWDKHARKYAASAIGNVDAYEMTLAKTRAHLTPQMKVIEIGAGTGSTALLLAPDVAGLTATDLSPEMMRIAQEKAVADGVNNVTFKVSSAQDAAGEVAAFDAVLAFNLLHLVPDLEGVLDTLSRNLKPGALFISKTVCLAEPSIGVQRFAIAAMIPVMRLIGKAPFVRRLTFAEVEHCVTASGFDIIETTTGPKMSRYIAARKN
ncbi:MAG: class I SAM-dependent methyltransferase [Sulfitobacter sp.]